MMQVIVTHSAPFVITQPTLALTSPQAAGTSWPISVANVHSCAITSNAVGYCWGMWGPWAGYGQDNNPNVDGSTRKKAGWLDTWGWILGIAVGNSASGGGGNGQTANTPYSFRLQICTSWNNGNCDQSTNYPSGSGSGIGGLTTSNSLKQAESWVVSMATAQTNYASTSAASATGCVGASPCVVSVIENSYRTWVQAYSLALLQTGAVAVFGDCRLGQCGYGSNNIVYTAGTNFVVQKNLGGFLVTALSAGPAHACFLLSSGAVRCSGKNDVGQLGIGNTVDQNSPQPMTATPPTHPAPFAAAVTYIRVIQVVTGFSFTCLLYNTGFVACFGTNTLGQLGIPVATTSLTSPTTLVALPLVTSGVNAAIGLSAGNAFVCALHADGSVWCWGSNANLQIAASGSFFDTPQLLPLLAGTTAVQVSCGWRHLCILRSDNAVVCGGANDLGQLGVAGTANVALTAATSPIFGYAKGSIKQLSTGSSAFASCILWKRAYNILEYTCTGANTVVGYDVGDHTSFTYSCDKQTQSSCQAANNTPPLAAITAATDGSKNIIVSAPSGTQNSVNGGIDHTPQPITQAATSAAVAFYLSDSAAALALTIWAPTNYSNAALGLRPTAYVGLYPCDGTYITSASAVVCQLNYASAVTIIGSAATAALSFSWTGGSAGPLYSVYGCPRPLTATTSLGATINPGGGSIVIVTGVCFTAIPTGQNPLNVSGASFVTIPNYGAYSFPLTRINSTAFSVVIPAGAGANIRMVLYHPNTVVKQGTTITYSYAPPVLQAAVSPSSGNNNVIGSGETIIVIGQYFSMLPGLVVYCNLTGVTVPVPCSVINNTAISVTVPGNVPPATTAPSLTYTQGGQGSNSISLQYKAVISSVSPSASYATTGYASKTFYIYGNVLGNTAADVVMANVGGANCSTTTYINASCIQCIFLPAAMAKMTGTTVSVTPPSWIPVTSKSGVYTPWGLPAIQRAVTKSRAANSYVWMDGVGLGHDSPISSNGSHNVNAPIINAIGLWSPFLGQSVPCQNAYFPQASLGSAITCYPQLAAIYPGIAYYPYILLEENINATGASPLSIDMAPVVTSITTARGSSVLSPLGEVVTVYGSFFGYPGRTLVSNVSFGGLNITTWVCVSDTAIQVTLPPYSTLSLLSVPLAVTVQNSPSAPWLLSYQVPSVASISPAQYYAVTGLPNKTFTITGTGFGLGSSDIASVIVGGANCSSNFTWLSPSSISCALTPALVALLNSTTVSVTLKGMSANPGSSNVFTPLGVPKINRLITAASGAYTAPIFIDGVGLGYGLAQSQICTLTSTSCNNAIVAVSLQDFAGNRSILPCTKTTYDVVLGYSLSCLPSVSVVSMANYALRIDLEDGIVLFSPTNITYPSTANKLSVSWNTVTLTSTAQPSTSASLFPLYPPVSVAVTTDSGTVPISPVTCQVMLSSANLPVTTIYSLLTGNTSSITSTTSAVFPYVGVVGLSGWNYTLQTKCAYNGVDPWFLSASVIQVRILPLYLNWTLSPTNGSLVSAAVSKALPSGFVAPLLPGPSVQLLYNGNGSTSSVVSFAPAAMGTFSTGVPSVPCVISIPTNYSATVSGLGTFGTSLNPLNASGSFQSFGVVAPLGAVYALTASCTWPTSEVVSATSFISNAVSLRLTWSVAPDASFYYGSPTSAFSVSVQRLIPATGSWSTFVIADGSVTYSDLFCTLSAGTANSTTPVSFQNGAISPYVPATGLLALAAMSISPNTVGVTGPITVLLTVQCAFRGQSIAPLQASTTMSNFSLAWTTPPSVGAIATYSNSAVNAPSLTFNLINRETLAVRAIDSTTTCVLSYTRAVTQSGSNCLATLGGTTSITLVSGFGNFSGWTIAAPLQATVTLLITCSRKEGGPTISTQLNMTILGAEASIVTKNPINASYTANTLVFFDVPSNLTARILIRNTTSSSNGSQYNLAPYSPTVYPPVTCSLSIYSLGVSPLANAVLNGGDTIYASIPVSAAGYVTFPVRLSAVPVYAVPLAISCSYGDTTISPVHVNFEVANVSLSWSLPPPSLFTYNTPTVPFAVMLQSIVPLPTPYYMNVPLTAADVSCTIFASSTTFGAFNDVSFSGGVASSFNATSSSVDFSRIALLPAAPSNNLELIVSAQCTMRSSFSTVIISRSTFAQALSLAWVVAPPLKYTASSAIYIAYLPTMSLSLLDQNSALLSSDSTTLCALSLIAFSSDGSQISTASFSGTTETTLTSGVATFSNWAINTPIAATATITVTCNRIQGGAAITATATLFANAAQVAFNSSDNLYPGNAMVSVLYDIPTSVTVLVSILTANASTIPTTFAPSKYVYGLYPPVSCNLYIDSTVSAAANAYLSGDASAYQGQSVDPSGYITFSVRLSAEAEVAVPLQVSCTYGDATLYVLSNLQVKVVAMAAMWTIPPALLFAYNTITPNSSATLQIYNNVTSTYSSANFFSISPSDVSCSTSVVDALDGVTAVPYTNGLPSTMLPSTALIPISSFQISPPSGTTAGYMVTISLSCTYRQYMQVPPLLFNSSLQNLYLDWIVPPPSYAMPSSSTQQINLPTVSVVLKNASGLPLLIDSTSSCSITVQPGTSTDATGTVSISNAVTVGNLQAIASSGTASFSGWGIKSPFGARIVLIATCNRIERGPTLTVTWPIIMYSVASNLTSFSSIVTTRAASLPTVLFNTQANASAQIYYLSPMSPVLGAPSAVIPYTASLTSTCSLILGTVPAALTASFSGDSALYQALPTNSSGGVTFTYQLSVSPVGYSLPLIAQCTVGDYDIFSPPSSIALASMAVSFLASNTVGGVSFPPLPATFAFNNFLPTIFAQFYAVVQNGTANTSLVLPTQTATLSDFACSVSGSSIATGSQLTVPGVASASTVFTVANASLAFSGLSPQPSYLGVVGPVDCTVSLTCSYRTSVLPTISFTTYMQNLTMMWQTPPPAYVERTPQGAGAVPLIFPAFSTALFYQDGTTPYALGGSCTLAATCVGCDAAAAFALSGTATISLSAAGVANFTNIWLTAPLESSVSLQVSCVPYVPAGVAAAPITTSTPALTSVAGVRVVWLAVDTIDASQNDTVSNGTWYWGSKVSISAAAVLHIPGSPFESALPLPLQNGITCDLTVSATAAVGKTIPTLAGSTSNYYGMAMDASSGQVNFTNTVLQADPGVPMPLQLLCKFADGGQINDGATLPPLLLMPTISVLNAQLLGSWPSLASASVPIAPVLQVGVTNLLNALLSGSIPATCSLQIEAVEGLNPDGLGWSPLSTTSTLSFSSLTGGSQAVLSAPVVNGVATFSNVTVATQNIAGFVSLVTCLCSQDAASSVVVAQVTSRVAFAALSLRWEVLPPENTTYGNFFSSSVSFLIQNNVSTTNPPSPIYIPFDPTSLGFSAQCQIEPLGTPEAILGGIASQSSFINGTAVFTNTLTLSSFTVFDIPLTASCTTLGSTISLAPSAVAYVTILQLHSEFASPPPTLAWPSTVGFQRAVHAGTPSGAIFSDPPAIVIYDVTNVTVPGAAGATCFAVTDTSNVDYTMPYSAQWGQALVNTPEAGYSFGVGGIPLLALDQVYLQAWWGSQVAINVKCTRPELDPIPVLSGWEVFVPEVQLEWDTMPPSSIRFASVIPLNFSILYYNQTDPNATYTLAVQDTVTQCTVCADVRYAPFGTPQRVPCNSKIYSIPQSSVLSGTQMGGNLMTAVYGFVDYTSLTLAGRIATYYDINITCQYGDMPYPHTLEASVYIEPCLPGEAPVSDFTACIGCGEGSYTTGGTGACILCPDGVLCTGSLLTILPGFYLALPPDQYSVGYKGDYGVTIRPDGRLLAVIAANTSLFQCWTPEACSVNTTEGSYGCSYGYTGVLCGVCDISVLYVVQGTQCIKCINKELDIVILTIIGFLVIMALVFVSIFMDFGSPSEAKTVWRILINYLSAVSAFSNYVAQGTSAFLSSFSILQSILVPGAGGGLELSPVQCELQLGYYTRFTATMFLPVICAAACILINIINIARYKGCGQGGRPFMRELWAFWDSQKAIAVAALVLFMAYPALTAKAFVMFQCLPIAIGGVHYLKIDLSVSCDTTQHAFYESFAYAVIGTLTAGLPLIFAWWLQRNEEKVKQGQNSTFFGTFGFLYQGYKTDKWYYYSWEAFVMARKAFIVAIAATAKDPIYQCTSVILLLSFCLGMQLQIAPFARPFFNFLEALTLLTLIFTMCISLMFLRAAQMTLGTLSTFSDPITSAEGQASIAAAGSMLNETSTSGLLILINIVCLSLLIYQFITIKRSEWYPRVTCAEQCMDCWDCRKSRSARRFVITELTKRLSTTDKAGGKTFVRKRSLTATALSLVESSVPTLTTVAKVNPLGTTYFQKSKNSGVAPEGKKEGAPAPRLPSISKPLRLLTRNQVASLRGAGEDRNATESHPPSTTSSSSTSSSKKTKTAFSPVTGPEANDGEVKQEFRNPMQSKEAVLRQSRHNVAAVSTLAEPVAPQASVSSSLSSFASSLLRGGKKSAVFSGASSGSTPTAASTLSLDPDAIFQQQNPLARKKAPGQ